MIFDNILKHLKRFFISLLVSVVCFAFLISIVRAGTIIAVLHTNAPTTQFVWLAERWSDAYKPLRKALENARLTDPNAPFVQRGLIEKTLLSIPNRIISLALQQTETLWMPPHLKSVTPVHNTQTAQQQTVSYDPPVETSLPSSDSYDDWPPSSPDENSVRQPAPTETTQATYSPSPATATKAAPYDPDASWAAIKTPDAPIYKESDGVRIENVPAGSVVDIVEERTTNQGIVYIGTVHSPKGRFEDVIVRKLDLQIYEGKRLTATTREEREQASNHARVLGEIAARKDELKELHNTRNPHHQPYHDALRRYQNFRQEAQNLQKTYTDSTGAARMDAGNRLRELKLEMSNLTPIVRDLQEKRDAWNAANQRNTTFNPEQDPQIMALRRQLETMEIPD